jgi:hypothetical protein
MSTRIHILNPEKFVPIGNTIYSEHTFTEGKFLVSDQLHSKLETFSYLIRSEIF